MNNPQSRRIWEWGGLAALLAVNAAVLSQLAFRFFNFFDFGSFLDASWRVARGQAPYADFIYNTGPIHLYLTGLFIKLFGFGKAAILSHIVLISSLVIVLTYWMTRRKVPAWASFLSAALSMACFYWLFPFPWYDHSSYFWGVPAIAVLARAVPFSSSRSAFWASAAAGAAAVLSWATKTNTGAGFLIGFAIFFLFNREYRRMAAAGFMTGGVAAVLVALVMIRFPRLFYEQTMAVYGNLQKDRLIRFYLLPVYFRNYYWLAVLSVLYPLFFNPGLSAVAGRLRAARIASGLGLPEAAARAGVGAEWLERLETSRIESVSAASLAKLGEVLGCSLDLNLRYSFQAHLARIGLFLGTVAAALFSLHTSSLREPGTMPLYGVIVGLGFMVLFASKRQCGCPKAERIHVFSIALLAALAVFLIAWEVHLAVRLATGKDDRVGYGTYSVQTPAMKGWRMRQDQGTALDGLVAFVSRFVRSEDSLLVLGDMQIVNGLTGRDAYKGIPFIFDIGQMPAPGRQLEAVSVHIRANPPDWIVTRRQPGGPFPINALIPYLGLSDLFGSSYQLVQTWGDYGIFRRRRNT